MEEGKRRREESRLFNKRRIIMNRIQSNYQDHFLGTYFNFNMHNIVYYVLEKIWWN